jgi:hypothetical protein
VDEELAGSCSIGDIVEVTGHAFMHASADAKGAAARLQVMEAGNGLLAATAPRRIEAAHVGCSLRYLVSTGW